MIHHNLRNALHYYADGQKADLTPGIEAITEPHIVSFINSLRLMQLGAAPEFVHNLTGLPKTSIKTIYKRVNRRNPHGGQSPFTDTWYIQNNDRMLHANIVWKWHLKLNSASLGSAERQIDLYELYLLSVAKTLLTISRAAFVPQLVRARLWTSHGCTACAANYISPVADTACICPACRIRHLYRCRHCGQPLEPTRIGRPRANCPACHQGVRYPPLVTYE